MGISIDQAWLAAFLACLVRAGGFVAICPPFASPAVSGRVRAMLSVSLAMAGASSMQGADTMFGSTGALVSGLVFQAFLGLALGFGVYLFFSALTIAGEYVDIATGFSASQTLDPVSGVSASITPRLFNLTATTLMFASGGHLLLVRGFVRAGRFQSMNLDRLGSSVASIAAQAIIAAIEIAIPVAGSLLIAEIALAMLGKAAPQLNVFQLGFAVKVLFGMMLLGASVALLPGQVNALLERAIQFVSGA